MRKGNLGNTTLTPEKHVEREEMNTMVSVLDLIGFPRGVPGFESSSCPRREGFVLDI